MEKNNKEMKDLKKKDVKKLKLPREKFILMIKN
jgi:hypothetical protein